MAWNLKEFRKILYEYTRLYESSTDQREKEKYLSYISNLKYEISIEELTKYERENLKEETITVGERDVTLNLDNGTCFGELTHNIYDVSKYDLYYPFVIEFRDKLNSLLKLDKYNFDYDGKLQLSKDEILDIVHDMFKSTTKEIYDLYLKIDKDDINFDPSMDADDGSSFCFPIVDKRYIEVGTKGDQENTLWTIAHEAGHVIGAMLNPDRYVEDEKFLELESQFFELVGLDFFNNLFNDEYYMGRMKGRLFEYFDTSKKIVAMKDVIDKSFETLDEQNNPYEYYSMLSKKNKDYSDVDISDNMKYLVGYIGALELFEVYKQDKGLAIELLKKIVCKDESKTEYQRIVDNINLNNHIDSHVKRLDLMRR